MCVALTIIKLQSSPLVIFVVLYFCVASNHNENPLLLRRVMRRTLMSRRAYLSFAAPTSLGGEECGGVLCTRHGSAHRDAYIRAYCPYRRSPFVYSLYLY